MEKELKPEHEAPHKISKEENAPILNQNSSKEINSGVSNETLSQEQPKPSFIKVTCGLLLKLKEKENIISFLHLFSFALFAYLLYQLNIIDTIKNDSRFDIAFFKLSMGMFFIAYSIYFYLNLINYYSKKNNETIDTSKASPYGLLIFFLIIAANIFFIASFKYVFYSSLLFKCSIGLSIVFIQAMGVININCPIATLSSSSLMMLFSLWGLAVKQKGFFFI